MTNTDVLLAYHVPTPGGGGVLLISSEGDDRMGAKIKTPKQIPMASDKTNPSLDQKLTPKNPMPNF